MKSAGRNNDYLSGEECDNMLAPDNQHTSPDWDGPGCYRMQTPAGSWIPDWEIHAYHGCTTHGGGYLATNHPTLMNKPVEATVCFNEWHNGTEYKCNRHVNITITNCVGYFVYRLSSLTCDGIAMKYCAAKGCSLGHYNFPTCSSMYRSFKEIIFLCIKSNYLECKCGEHGLMDEICDPKTGFCLCQPTYGNPFPTSISEKCDYCWEKYYGFPHCERMYFPT